MNRFQSVDDAFQGMLSRLLTEGEREESRNGPTLELSAQTIIIEDPTDRFLRSRARHNNPFAAIAESLWVIAGRNDLAYLTPYLRRAADYSDDGGVSWRGGYGPRLRDWHGVDQLAEVRALLGESKSTRRAVMSIFDPAQDFRNSKDIPCNNWLHFLSRAGKLDLHVAARSTDIWFGFSAINAFEWSVLQEMLARWLHLEVGNLIFFTSSLHLYVEQQTRAQQVLEASAGRRAGNALQRLSFDTEWDGSGSALDEWMSIEARLRGGADLRDLSIDFDDPMLMGYIRAIDVFWAFKRGASVQELQPRLVELRGSDLGSAIDEFLERPSAITH